jgi:hypothetical protein
MNHDSRNLVVGGFLLSTLWFVVVYHAIERMHTQHRNIEAIARVYMPEGCSISKTVVSSVPGEYILECGETLYRVR